jgi:predicted signal transduction protein with EAL and GGDEF domain
VTTSRHAPKNVGPGPRSPEPYSPQRATAEHETGRSRLRVIDLDDFKGVHDGGSHTADDRVPVELARV